MDLQKVPKLYFQKSIFYVKNQLMKFNHLSFVKWFSSQFTFTALLDYFHSFFTLTQGGCLAVINIKCPTQVSTRMEFKSAFWNTFIYVLE